MGHKQIWVPLFTHSGGLETRFSYPERVKDGCLDMIGFDKEIVLLEDVTDPNMHWVSDREGHGHKAVLYKSHYPATKAFIVFIQSETPLYT